VEFRLLGEVEVLDDGGIAVAIRRAKVRALLAVLLLHRNQPVAADALVDAVWGGSPPPRAAATLQSYMSELRKLVGSEMVVTGPTGYQLRVADGALDAQVFEQHVCEGREAATTGDLEGAEALFVAALAMWRGPPLAEFTYAEFARAAIGRLEELRLACCEERFDVGLRLGRHGELLPDVETTARANPFRERLWGQLMLAFYRSGRQADALAAYGELRIALAEELGIDPSRELKDLETAVLLQQPELTLKVPTPQVADGNQAGATTPRAKAIPPCPYRGLFAFREEDAHDFFGRQVVTRALADAVRAQCFVAVLGASGSGKSSVVFAGLVPELRAEDGWCVAAMRPGKKPFQSLAAALIPLLEPQMTETDRLVEITKLARALGEGGLSLSDVARRLLAKRGAAKLLLVVDQFEELYTTTEPAQDQSTFVDHLLANLAPDAGVHCVITLRGDFLGNALSHRPLTDALQESAIMLGPMSPGELRQVVERPAEHAGVPIEEGLTARMLDAVGNEPGNLPLLQFALTLMWDQQDQRGLTHFGYDAMGGLRDALSRYADDVFERLSDDDRNRAQQIFTQMVRPGDGVEDTRRGARRNEVGEENWPLVARLADARILVTGRDDATGEEQVDIVHEALITSWERLRGWIANDRTFRLFQERLRAAQRQWERSDRDHGALLRGAPLTEASSWDAIRGDAMTDPERSFIAASQAERDRDERQAESMHERELLHAQTLTEQAQALASEQQGRAEQQARDAKYRGRLASALAVALIVAIIAAGLASRQRNRAVSASSTAQSLRLLSTVEALTAEALTPANTKNNQLASLLAREAFDLNAKFGLGDTARVDDALRRILGGTYPSVAVNGHARAVEAIAFSPDGKTLAYGGADGTVRLLDLDEKGVAPAIFRGNAGAITSVAFSYDGRSVASGSDATVRLWDVNHPEASPLLLHGHTGIVTSVAFSPGGDTLASGSADQTVTLWSMAHLDAAPTVLPGSYGLVRAVAFSPKGNTLAAGSADQPIHVWDLSHPELAPVVLDGHSGGVNSVAFSPDGSTLASGDVDNTVQLWDLTHGNALSNLDGPDAAVTSVAFGRGGQSLVAGSADHTVRLWDLAHRDAVPAVLDSHNDTVTAVAFDRAWSTLASGSADETIRLWNPAHPEATPTVLSGHTAGITALAFNGNGSILASSSDDQTVRLWDPAHPDSARAVLRNETASFTSIAFQSGGRTLAAGSYDQKVRLWDINRLAPGPFVLLDGPTARVTAIAFSPDGKKVVAGSYDQKIRVWDIANPSAAPTVIYRENGGVTAVGFSPDGKTLASANYDNTVLLWDLQHPGTAPTVLKGHSDIVTSVAFSPDGKTLASGSYDHTIRIWDAQHLRTTPRVLKGHTNIVTSVAFSRDSKTLASGSYDHTIRIWDPRRAQSIPTVLTVHTDAVTSVAFSPDGKSIVAGSNDSTTAIVSLTSTLADLVCTNATRNLDRSEWDRYIGSFGVAYRRICPDIRESGSRTRSHVA
jgi:WD40 repeat protein/DNA-binding SARP family transcriptional activator